VRELPAGSPRRSRRILRFNDKYADILSAGFATADFEGQPEPETLQCRNELDRTNWLGLVVDCQVKIALGYGDVVEVGTAIRCTSNRMYQVSPNDGLARMLVLLGQAQTAQANHWRLKDAARDALTQEALDAIDENEGWP
jgi:hypothetical protein